MHLTVCSCWPSPLPSPPLVSPSLPFLTVTLVQCSRLFWCTIFPLFHGWQCTVKDSLLITEQLICKPPSAVRTLTDRLSTKHMSTSCKEKVQTTGQGRTTQWSASSLQSVYKGLPQVQSSQTSSTKCTQHHSTGRSVRNCYLS